MGKISRIFLACVFAVCTATAQTWTADNGNGTYTNPLFFEEFSDPCMIRVGSDFYLTGTTMHTMPGLPILHSKDLVNWQLISYVFDRFELGPEFSFQNGKDMYGQGIWAPTFVYNKGTFYIFANVNGHTTQVYISKSPYGPWEHWTMKKNLHDLSVLFDDNGKTYVCWGANKIYMAQLNEDLTDIVPDTQRLIAENVGEGSHLYKINGNYYIIWTIPGNSTPQLAGKSNSIYGPYEVVTISDKNHMGVHEGYGLKGGLFETRKEFYFNSPNMDKGLTLHQGGIIDTPTGEWWGYSMQDHNSLGRVTNLTPVTWENGFPYFGLPGNLAKSPKTWVKPNVGLPQQPIVPIAERNDDFSSDKLNILWQWNHLPDDGKWSLTENPGKLRLHSLPADDFWHARNSLTQRAIGLVATCNVDVDASGLEKGDVAGLALLNHPYGWIGICKENNEYRVTMYDQARPAEKATILVNSPNVRFSVLTDFEKEEAQFYYSTDQGATRKPLGGKFIMVFQLKTFQGVRYALFNYNEKGKNGGYADFDNYVVDESYPKGFRRPIPYGKYVSFTNLTDHKPFIMNGQKVFEVVDMGLGRVALKTSAGYVSVDSQGKVSLAKKEKPGQNESFQWTEIEQGHLVFLSLATNRYLQNIPAAINAFVSVPAPDQKDHTRFIWNIVN